METIKGLQSPEEAKALEVTITLDAYELVTSKELNDARPYTDEEKLAQVEALKELLAVATDDEKREFWQQMAFYWLGMLLAFHELLALLVHGRSMRQLVNDAKRGDDKAYVLAVQTDRTVLNLPYFADRLLRAQISGDHVFLDSLGYRMKNPLINGKIKNRTLFLLFAILESENKLDMPLKELLQLCQDVGVYGKQYGVGDVNSLGKRRREYKKNQGTRKYF